MKDARVTYELVAQADADRAAESPLRMLHRALRGRYPLVASLAIVLAPLCAVLGYRAIPPRYESTGLVRIEGALPAILHPTQESQVPPMFDSFVSTQVALLQSRQMLDAAINQPEMIEAGWPRGLEGVAELSRCIDVRRRRGEQVIDVGVLHRDPVMAAAAVNAILVAYKSQYTDPGGLSPSTKEKALAAREQQIEDELRQLRVQMLEHSDQYGLHAIEQIHVQKVDELLAIDGKLGEIELARTRLESGQAADVPGSAPFSEAGPGRLTPLQERELALQAEIQSLRGRYVEGHPMIRQLTRQLEALRLQMDLRQRALANGGSAADDEAAINTSALAQLGAMKHEYERMRLEIREEAADLGRTRVALAGLQERIDQAQERLVATRARLDEIRFETTSQDYDRISTVAGELPVAPVTDRRAALAAIGAFMGLFGSAGIVFLLGACDRRLRFAAQLEALGLPAPLLALVPEADGSAPGSRSRVVRSVQRLRILLELRRRDGGPPVTHAITSAGRGEGKTSLCLELARSFAAAGRRTLMVDGDFVSASLTRELDAGNESRGLCQAIDDPDGSEGCEHPTAQADLWIMPLGTLARLDPRSLTRARVAALLETLRRRYDAIVIDAGSVLTDLEASILSAAADAVIFVVGRDQRGDVVRAAVSRLEQIGAACEGVVFHRAALADYARHELASGGFAAAPEPFYRHAQTPPNTGARGGAGEAEAGDAAATKRKLAA